MRRNGLELWHWNGCFVTDFFRCWLFASASVRCWCFKIISVDASAGEIFSKLTASLGNNNIENECDGKYYIKYEMPKNGHSNVADLGWNIHHYTKYQKGFLPNRIQLNESCGVMISSGWHNWMELWCDTSQINTYVTGDWN